MRSLMDHKTNPANHQLVVEADEDLNGGGAPIRYLIHGFDTALNDFLKDPSAEEMALYFQDGPPDNGINGITHEVLLAILIDRFDKLQAGPFACRENALVKTHLEEALMWCERRSRERTTRGVEGYQKP